MAKGLCRIVLVRSRPSRRHSRRTGRDGSRGQYRRAASVIEALAACSGVHGAPQPPALFARRPRIWWPMSLKRRGWDIAACCATSIVALNGTLQSAPAAESVRSIATAALTAARRTQPFDGALRQRVVDALRAWARRSHDLRRLRHDVVGHAQFGARSLRGRRSPASALAPSQRPALRKVADQPFRAWAARPWPRRRRPRRRWRLQHVRNG
jgi:hypothetical protein